MTRVIVDDELRAKLGNFSEVLEFCDPSGHVLGVYQRVVDRSLYEGVEPEVSEEELDRRMREIPNVKCLTTEEVLEHLRKL